RAPKVGLLDALIQLADESELYFVPVGINYDRVLEDEALLAELHGRDRPPTRTEQVAGAVRLLWMLPWRVAVNAVRVAGGRLQRAARAALREDLPRTRELAKLEGELLESEEAEEIARLGLERLVQRRVLELTGGRLRQGRHPHARDLLWYYARSLSALEQPSG